MNELDEIKKEIAEIKERNKKVEMEKAWELSGVRKISIIIATYFCVSIVMIIVRLPDPLLNAIVPTLGFLLSVQSLPFIKKIWIKRYENN